MLLFREAQPQNFIICCNKNIKGLPNDELFGLGTTMMEISEQHRIKFRANDQIGRYKNIETTEIFALSTMLDPRFKGKFFVESLGNTQDLLCRQIR